MIKKVQLIHKTLRLTCTWVQTGDEKRPLACVWVETRTPRSIAQAPADQ
jgi:hypothetical protein